MVLIKDGQTEYTVLLPEESIESDCIAAETLQKYVKLCTGAELSISFQPTAKFISIGNTKAYRNLGVDLSQKELNGDGFKIIFQDGNIYLCALSNRGVVYAVYEFLERYLGVRFLTESDEILPYNDIVEIEEKDVVEIPSFSSRSYYAEAIICNAEFASKMRLVAPYSNKEKTDKYGGGFLSDWCFNEMHSMQTFMPADKYYEKHPEWYASNKRRAWLCLTNGLTDDDEDDRNPSSLLSTMVEQVILELTLHPTQKYVMIGHEDNLLYCECSRCVKSRQRHKTVSGYYMVWINAIAKRIEEWRLRNCPQREINVVAFSYLDTIIPPVLIKNGEAQKEPIEFLERKYWAPLKINKGEIVPINQKVIPEKNVVVFCALLSTCYMHKLEDENCDWNAYCSFALEGWKSLGARVMVWYYGANFNHHLWWLPNRKTFASHLEYYKKYNPLFVICQGAPRESGFYQAKLNAYLCTKLMWDSTLDVDVLTKQFNRMYFGEGIGKTVDRFIEKMELHYQELDEKYNGLYHSDIYDNFPISFLPENFSYDFLTNCIDELQECLLAAQEEDKQKLKRVLIQPLYMLVYNFKNYEYIDVKYLDLLEQYLLDLGIKHLNEAGKTPQDSIREIRDSLMR